MDTIKLNNIDFNVYNFKQSEHEDLFEAEFSIISIGDREFYLTKEVLSKKDLKLILNENEIDVRVVSYSYQQPNELDSDTNVSFAVKLKELKEDDVESVNVGLITEAMRVNSIISALIKFCDEKGIFSKEEFQSYYGEYKKERDSTEDLSNFLKRVFNYDIESSEKE
jgi:hypothetical protein